MSVTAIVQVLLAGAGTKRIANTTNCTVPGTKYKALRSAGGLRRPLRSGRKSTSNYYAKRTVVHDRIYFSDDRRHASGENSSDATYASSPWRLPCVPDYTTGGVLTFFSFYMVYVRKKGKHSTA